MKATELGCRPTFTHCFSENITNEQDLKVYQLFEHTQKRFRDIRDYECWLKVYGMEGVELLTERLMYAQELYDQMKLNEKRLEEIEALYGIVAY